MSPSSSRRTVLIIPRCSSRASSAGRPAHLLPRLFHKESNGSSSSATRVAPAPPASSQLPALFLRAAPLHSRASPGRGFPICRKQCSDAGGFARVGGVVERVDAVRVGLVGYVVSLVAAAGGRQAADGLPSADVHALPERPCARPDVTWAERDSRL